MRRWRTFTWATVAGTAAFVPFDVVTRHWFDAAVTTAGGATAAYFGRRNEQFAARREQAAHRPDYAKIRRLELELGLRNPDPPLIGSGLGQTTGPFIRHAQPRPPADPRTIASQAGDVSKFREAQEAYAKWEVCPVCTRRHAGRCAG